MTEEEAKEYLMDISYQLGTMGIEYLNEKDGIKMREAIKILEQKPSIFLSGVEYQLVNPMLKSEDKDGFCTIYGFKEV